MDKLISQEKTIRDLRGIKDMLVAAGDPFLASVMNRAIACVENQPAANDMEVVLCKDCKFWDPETGFCEKHSKFYHDGLDWDMFNDDDFCSQVEMRTDG